ncbi:MAG: glycosyltransferase [Theionarchaea archaeon]|nr:glycosyltransferase [Theionarchaea archaeon]MBU7000654.1 glycosyltransferase [Theionarchaea archaeon]MBU7021016.1 glycosyltransferase [Theionarchaea archaeon]MBU7035699.1 glycosyltransferase [Theionarchaea archaeon]MBU7040897.1 glycosyltransferase [Theionarchaea archaeon]
MTNVALIPAAGRGLRMYPITEKKPKAMLTIHGKPLLQYNLELLKTNLDCREVYIVTGEYGDQISSYFEDGSSLGLEINYITQKTPRGIGHAIGLGEEYIDTPFFVILGDEMYIDTNHQDMLSLFSRDFNAICAFQETDDLKAIQQNYTARLEGDRILSVIEKPGSPGTDLLGVGTYAFTPLIFDYIRNASPSSLRNEIEITDVIDTLAHQESKVYAFFLEGFYTNINTIHDLNRATYQWRRSHFDSYSISVVMPAYNEEASIKRVIDDFSRTPVAEIIVVDNNSVDGTAKIAEKEGARVVSEPRQGYGNALKCGMDAAKEDIVVITESDHSFRSKDLPSIVEQLKEADMVVGTRTSKSMIEQGANMDWFLRWGNRALGKLVSVLWCNKGASFTDVGCTYRGLWKWTYQRIRDNMRAEGAPFSVEMMVETLKADMTVTEIPVTYCRRRGGESKHSAGKVQNVKTGLRMLQVIMRKRLGLF